MRITTLNYSTNYQSNRLAFKGTDELKKTIKDALKEKLRAKSGNLFGAPAGNSMPGSLDGQSTQPIFVDKLEINNTEPKKEPVDKAKDVLLGGLGGAGTSKLISNKKSDSSKETSEHHENHNEGNIDHHEQEIDFDNMIDKKGIDAASEGEEHDIHDDHDHIDSGEDFSDEDSSDWD